jgi:predicted  nucleic acid-binding Zn-ribbon protein
MKGRCNMATQKILDRNYKIEGGVVTIVETTQKQLNKAELQAQKIQLLNRQTQLSNQVTELQKQSKSIDESIKEIDEMIASLDGGGEQDGEQVL